MLTAQQLVQELKKIKRELKLEPEIEEFYLRDDRPIQIVFRKKPREIVYFRAKPITAYKPTLPQIRARLAFAEAASRTKGVKWKGEDTPAAAEAVKEALKGRRFGKTEKIPKWMKILAAWLEVSEHGETVRYP